MIWQVPLPSRIASKRRTLNNPRLNAVLSGVAQCPCHHRTAIAACHKGLHKPGAKGRSSTKYYLTATFLCHHVYNHPKRNPTITRWVPSLRRERDSNPRRCDPQRFSRPPHSTALPSLLLRAQKYIFFLTFPSPPCRKAITRLYRLLYRDFLVTRPCSLTCNDPSKEKQSRSLSGVRTARASSCASSVPDLIRIV